MTFNTVIDQEQNNLVLNEIAELFSTEFDAPVFQVLNASLNDDDVISGSLISGGNFYNYSIDEQDLNLEFDQEATAEINDYAEGFLVANGIKIDSVESPYDYAVGFFRFDAQVRCKKGGVPCGKICLPKGAVCRKNAGGAGQKIKARLKSPGLATGVAAGVIGAAAIGGAAGVGVVNRKEIASGAKKTGEHLKNAFKEGKSEFNQGRNAAKNIIEQGKKGEKKVKEFLSPLKKPDEEADKAYKDLKNNTKNIGVDLDKIGAKDPQTARKIILAASRGAVKEAAIENYKMGVKNAAKAVSKNLKKAGSQIKQTGKEILTNTKTKAKK